MTRTLVRLSNPARVRWEVLYAPPRRYTPEKWQKEKARTQRLTGLAPHKYYLLSAEARKEARGVKG